MKPMKRNGHGHVDRVSVISLLAAAIVFGLMPSFNKIAVESGIPPIGYAFWFCAIATILTATGCVLTRSVPRMSWRDLRDNLAMGGLGVAFPLSLLAFVAPHLPASVVALVIALVPAVTYLLSLIARVETWRWMSLVGLAFGFAGVSIMAGPGGTLPDPEAGLWLAASLAAPTSFAMANVYAARFQPTDRAPFALGFGQAVGATVILLPVMFATASAYFPALPLRAADYATAGAGIVMSVILVLFYLIVRRAGPLFFSQFTYLNVLTGLLWAMAFFGDRITPTLAVALGLMFVGLTLVNMSMRRAIPAPAVQAAGDGPPA